MEIDYKKIGLKSGIEIHQQIDTHKLFCDCPSTLRVENPDSLTRRKLHAVVGETGKTDIAAAYEHKKEREFIYESYSDSTCLVELDEEPPHQINQEALKVALQVSLLLNAKPLEITQVMRKTVIDGSNTSGFQRTLLIARNGFLETSSGRINIEGICLEEDAARIISQNENEVIYRLDRLGIPLIEITTAPDIKSPLQAKEVALHLGEILRACKVKRGIGTIRQDVNMSIAKGNRAEIKGVQDPPLIMKVIETEIERQQNLIKIHEQLKNTKSYSPKSIDITAIFDNTECKIVKSVIERKGKVYATKLPGFAGMLGVELYKDRRFGTEISEYAKVGGVGGIIHSDENMSKYQFSEIELKEIKKMLKIGEKDAFIIVADEDSKARRAIEAAISRAGVELEIAVPLEVRKANSDGSTSYLRPLPGSARMYPETDLPLIKISREMINDVKKSLPRLKHEIREELESGGLSSEMSKILLQENKLEEFKELIKITNNPNLIVKLLVLYPREIASHEGVSLVEINKRVTLDILEHLLIKLSKNEISEGHLKSIISDVALGKDINDIKLEKTDNSDIDSFVVSLIKEKPGFSANAYMGLVMQKFKGKVSGKEVMDILKKYVK
ncbi:MAG: Glu-tRNA(Gln) amidotransferase subunit GatE [archaeon]